MELAVQGLRLDTTWTIPRQPEDGLSAEKAPQTQALDLVKLLLPIWGAGLLLFYGSVALFNEDAFISGGGLLLLISVAVGVSFLVSPWLRRASGLVVLGLACLWGVNSVIVHRHDLPLLAWALAWGLVAYALPGLLLARASSGRVSLRLQNSQQTKAVTIGLVLLVLFLIACMFGLGIS